MIPGVKSYTKKKKKKNQTDRTLGQMVKAKLYRPITSIEIETVIKNLPKNKNPDRKSVV